MANPPWSGNSLPGHQLWVDLPPKYLHCILVSGLGASTTLTCACLGLALTTRGWRMRKRRESKLICGLFLCLAVAAVSSCAAHSSGGGGGSNNSGCPTNACRGNNNQCYACATGFCVEITGPGQDCSSQSGGVYCCQSDTVGGMTPNPPTAVASVSTGGSGNTGSGGSGSIIMPAPVGMVTGTPRYTEASAAKQRGVEPAQAQPQPANPGTGGAGCANGAAWICVPGGCCDPSITTTPSTCCPAAGACCTDNVYYCDYLTGECGYTCDPGDFDCGDGNCCASGEQCCAGGECCPEGTQCSPNGGCELPPTACEVDCGDYCCPNGSSCASGGMCEIVIEACPTDSVDCGTYCCESGSQCDGRGGCSLPNGGCGDGVDCGDYCCANGSQCDGNGGCSSTEPSPTCGDGICDPSEFGVCADCSDAQGFDCGDGTSISPDLACNGNYDCANGADEDASICSDETSCCVATNGCPGETGNNCGETCCCCPTAQACCPDQSGCCAAP
jgi:hypothetical protein